MTKLNPKEIYLIELFTSPIYLAELRDAWGEMIQHLEACLNNYMRNLPSNYRLQPLPEQPDIVWGERVLPNFRSTYQYLCDGVIALSHGDSLGLYSAHGPQNDRKGQAEFSVQWLAERDLERYDDLLSKASTMASNICATVNSLWCPNELGDPGVVGTEIVIPITLPNYQLVPTTSISTGSPVTLTGIYLPNVDNSCPQYLSSHKPAPNAIVLKGVEELLHPSTGKKYGENPVFERVPCVWTLVARTERDDKPTSTALIQTESHRTPGGNACPASGFYFTPASAGSRRYFEKGTLMPCFNSSYGATIWQWDDQQ